MPSAFIPSRLGYPAMHLVIQPVHQRPVHPGPLVLRAAPLKYPTPAPDRDRTVSRRSEPSSRTALMGEQPNPWDLLQPQDAMSRHRGKRVTELEIQDIEDYVSVLDKSDIKYSTFNRYITHMHTFLQFLKMKNIEWNKKYGTYYYVKLDGSNEVHLMTASNVETSS